MMLIGVVRLALDAQVFLQATLALKQALRARAWDRFGRQAAILVKLVARLTHPPLTALDAGDDHLRIKRKLHTLRLRARRLHRRVVSTCTLPRELLLGRTQRSASTLVRPQVLGQLIATLLAVELILSRVNVARLLQDLACELLVINV